MRQLALAGALSRTRLAAATPWSSRPLPGPWSGSSSPGPAARSSSRATRSLPPQATQALWRDGGHEVLARFCSSLLLVALQAFDVDFNHVHSHECNPFNELADCLTKRAAAGDSAHVPPGLAALVDGGGSCEWEWIQEAPEEVRAAYPPERDGEFIFAEARSVIDPCRLAGDGPERDCRDTGDVATVVRFGTLNVCTLGDADARSKFVPGRPAMIRKQVRELGVHLLGVQEGRTSAGARCTDGFVAISSGAHRGCLGCELWADAETPYAVLDGRKYFFRLTDFVVIHSDPRLLIVRLTSQRLRCTTAVGHAPHAGHEDGARDAWRKRLEERLGGLQDVVLLVDANARLGSQSSEAVGCGGFRQDEDDGGAYFHRTLLQLGLWLPATFGDEDRAAFAWVSTAGQRHRIDHVAVPAAWGLELDPGGSARVAPRVCKEVPGDVQVVDSACDKDDHYLVMLDVPVLVRRSHGGVRWRPQRVDQAALKDAACCADFRDALRQIPLAQWDITVDEHERSLAAAVRDAAERSFGKPRAKQRREHIDDVAWSLIQNRRTVKRWSRASRIAAAGRGVLLRDPPDAAGIAKWALARAHEELLGQHLYAALATDVIAATLTDEPMAVDAVDAAARTFLRSSSGVLKAYLKHAAANFLEDAAKQLADAQADGAHSLAWSKLRALTVRGGAKWRGARPLPGRTAADGTRATTSEEVAGVVISHFAGIEAAEVSGLEELAARHATAVPCIAPGASRSIDNVCDRISLQKLFATAKRGKACGADGLLDDYCALAPAEMTELFHPLVVKCALRVQEPLAHKCGIAVDLWKGKGDHWDMKHYRSLLLNSVI